MAALYDTDCRTHPGSDLLAYSLAGPVSYNNFTLDAHTGYHVAPLTVAVCRLVLIHEIHVDGVVRNLLVKLCM